MKKTIFYIFTLAMIAFSFTFASKDDGGGGGVKFNSAKWGDVTKEAREKDKPIFAMVCAPWCSNCAKMKASVFPDKELGDFINENFVSTMVNSEDNMSNMRVTNWGVKTVPTMVFLDKNKKVVYMVSGLKNKQQVLEEAQKALEKMR